MVCTGCALLCDDVEVGENDCRHACRIGDAHITSTNQVGAMVDQSPVDMDTAIESAAEILMSAEKPVCRKASLRRIWQFGHRSASDRSRTCREGRCGN